MLRKEKRALRLTFLVRRRPGGEGFFHPKVWGSKSSCPPSKVCLPWVSRRGIWDVPKILPGCPGPLGVFKKFVQKKFVRIFRSLVLLRKMREKGRWGGEVGGTGKGTGPLRSKRPPKGPRTPKTLK